MSPARIAIGGTTLVAALAATAIAVWPASAADKAYDDGVKVGEALTAVYEADTQAEAEAAIADLDAAVADTRTHAGDAVADQAYDQAEAFDRAAEGAIGAATAEDAWEQDVYQAELEVAMDDLVEGASDFRADGPQVHQGFWEGVQDGLES